PPFAPLADVRQAQRTDVRERSEGRQPACLTTEEGIAREPDAPSEGDLEANEDNWRLMPRRFEEPLPGWGKSSRRIGQLQRFRRCKNEAVQARTQLLFCRGGGRLLESEFLDCGGGGNEFVVVGVDVVLWTAFVGHRVDDHRRLDHFDRIPGAPALTQV